MDKNSDRSDWWQGWLQAEEAYNEDGIDGLYSLINRLRSPEGMWISPERGGGVVEYFEYINREKTNEY